VGLRRGGAAVGGGGAAPVGPALLRHAELLAADAPVLVGVEAVEEAAQRRDALLAADEAVAVLVVFGEDALHPALGDAPAALQIFLPGDGAVLVQIADEQALAFGTFQIGGGQAARALL